MDIRKLQAKVIKFRDERDWAQYHNPKDLAISLSLEAAELLEIFQWKDTAQVEVLKFDSDVLRKVKEKLGDILIYALTLAHELGFDPTGVTLDKVKVNGKKHPVDRVKGKVDKSSTY